MANKNFRIITRQNLDPCFNPAEFRLSMEIKNLKIEMPNLI